MGHQRKEVKGNSGDIHAGDRGGLSWDDIDDLGWARFGPGCQWLRHISLGQGGHVLGREPESRCEAGATFARCGGQSGAVTARRRQAGPRAAGHRLGRHGAVRPLTGPSHTEFLRQGGADLLRKNREVPYGMH